ncbi:hypothetical protein EDI_284240 [Entamoeba dispar SAW760]|uniref:PPM-type phosphatase domain-containing protein n=1 Tax=Entamoeba dispar (strain ATCC PRA-260 / SAW760) TaxID=370354 RepID=B0E5G3_ENTDS|nr:uncharacterized protein EDI_284240 [Entamoeba dispar SAW760]EDR30255.1 hypothetical protein EDI_284240 [Entamoeba dispar SAW760]|eukprot:EDR30255.1 hypothetical protein EDI_284240 [Entamoeba dispar SAW760]
MEISLKVQFIKTFKPFIKSIPTNIIEPIKKNGYCFHICDDPLSILGNDQSFGMTSFSTYPIIDGIKQGEPNCDRIGLIRFSKSTVMIIADGCGWGIQPHQASLIAVRSIMETIVDEIETCQSSKDIASMLVDSAYNAHIDILKKSTKIKGIGSTTILIACLFSTKDLNQQLIVLSIGDSQCFIYNDKHQNCVALNPKWCRCLLSTKDSGGRIGSADGNHPDLKSSMLKIVNVYSDDIILLTSDGFCDNFQSSKTLISLDSIISSRIISSANMSDFIENISKYLIQTTDLVRQFHTENKNKMRPINLTGKLDHASIGAFRVEPINLDLGLINIYCPSILKSLYPNSLVQRKSVRSRSYSDIEVKENVEQSVLKEKSSNSSSGALTHRVRNGCCPTPLIYSDNFPLLYPPKLRKGNNFSETTSCISPPRKSPDVHSTVVVSPELSFSYSPLIGDDHSSRSCSCFTKFFLKDSN